jgi:hypothetical protein
MRDERRIPEECFGQVRSIGRTKRGNCPETGQDRSHDHSCFYQTLLQFAGKAPTGFALPHG